MASQEARRWTMMNAYLIGAYVIVLHLVTFILIQKVDAVPKIVNQIDMAIGVREQFSALMKEHRGVVMLGDSHTWTLGQADGGFNRGASGTSVADVQAAMPADIAKAPAILLMIGTNDIWRGTTTGLPERLDHLAETLPEGVPLIWSGIPPGNDFRLDLEEVRAANRVIQALCAARPWCAYVDTWALLADDQGRPIDGLFVADGVHLSAEGYRQWLGALDAALDRFEH
jgi:lysophospholipase L1-like esterase